MDQYIIKGGNPLVGEVEIGGAKNAAPLREVSSAETKKLPNPSKGTIPIARIMAIKTDTIFRTFFFINTFSLV